MVLGGRVGWGEASLNGVFRFLLLVSENHFCWLYSWGPPYSQALMDTVVCLILQQWCQAEEPPALRTCFQ